MWGFSHSQATAKVLETQTLVVRGRCTASTAALGSALADARAAPPCSTAVLYLLDGH